RSGAHSSHADVTYRRDARALESLRRYLPARRALEPREGLNSRRALVGGSTRDHAPAHRPSPAQGDQLELLGEEDGRIRKARRHRWAWLLAHLFAADLEKCPRCGGAM